MGAVDLHEVAPERRAGVALDYMHTARTAHQTEHRRPRALTAREALLALQFEALLVYVAAANLANGTPLTETDMERLGVAVRRIDYITEEAAT